MTECLLFIDSALASDEYTNDDVPFSCCDPASPRPCVHHHVATDQLHFQYSHQDNHTLYRTGCKKALMDFFGDVLLRSVGLCFLFMFVLQVGATYFFFQWFEIICTLGIHTLLFHCSYRERYLTWRRIFQQPQMQIEH